MRVALVSPYSWTYPGGVTRHIEELAGELSGIGHDVRILSPYDPDDALSRRRHRGAAPQRREPPEGFVSLGRTIGFPANGAISNLAVGSGALLSLRGELRAGRYDVVHIHEPVAPLVSWDALCCVNGPALVGTFHSFSENLVSNEIGCLLGARRRMNRLHVRIAVSQAAAWTGRRFFGGSYRVVPNGVHVPAEPPAAANFGTAERRPLRILCIGQAVERKGLPVLLAAFEALREHVPAVLTLVGASPDEVAPLLLEDRGVRALGRVGEAEKLRELGAADVLCAPSLHGESFGMVLTEGFAAGLPVVASDIPGYRDVLRDGREGMLVAPGDPLALAEALRRVALDDALRETMAAAARVRAERFSWPHVAAEVASCYEDARALASAPRRLAARYGFVRSEAATSEADRSAAAVRPAATPRLAGALLWARVKGRGAVMPPPAAAGIDAAGASREALAWSDASTRLRSRSGHLLRRLALVSSSLAVAGLAAAGVADVGPGRVLASLASSKPGLLLAGWGLMCAAMIGRGVAWHAILRAAPTWRRASLADAMQGTMIGVLMSATLPARLGEPSRALVVARRLGRTRETLPVVLGTQVSQMLLNLLAVLALGVVTAACVRGLPGPDAELALLGAVPLAAALALLLAPVIVPGAGRGRSLAPGGLSGEVRAALRRVAHGLRVFRRPADAAAACLAQLLAWGLQLLSCWLVLAGLGLAGKVDMAGAAAVLFAVNVTALIPVTPANVGVFQAAAAAVLVGVYGVSAPAALAYGFALQGVELLTALAMGVPALAKEGLSWRELRLRTMHAVPVRLAPLPAPRPAAGATSQTRL